MPDHPIRGSPLGLSPNECPPSGIDPKLGIVLPIVLSWLLLLLLLLLRLLWLLMLLLLLLLQHSLHLLLLLMQLKQADVAGRLPCWLRHTGCKHVFARLAASPIVIYPAHLQFSMQLLLLLLLMLLL